MLDTCKVFLTCVSCAYGPFISELAAFHAANWNAAATLAAQSNNTGISMGPGEDQAIALETKILCSYGARKNF